MKKKITINCARMMKASVDNESRLMASEYKITRLVDSCDSETSFNEVIYLINLVDQHFQESRFIDSFSDVKRLFEGFYPGYRACNTKFHDFSHTCAVMLAMSRLIHGAFIKGKVFSSREVVIGMVAALMHDTGYMQESDDLEGTGAKHTLTHIERSIAFLREYFKDDPSCHKKDIKDLADIILCTGLNIKAAEIDFSSPKIATIGQMLGTADLIGQMADRLYPEKLRFLYREFEEGGISQFTSEVDLMRKTIGFYEWVKQRISIEFNGVNGYMLWHFLSRWGIDCDLYQKCIMRNIDCIKYIIGSSIHQISAKV